VAEAVFQAARGRWREYWLGWPTAQTIIGNVLWPGALDRYLGRKAVDGQKTDKPVAVGRRDNLDHSVGPLHRTRGSFSVEAANHAVLAPAPLARLTVVGLGAVAFMALGMGLRAVGASGGASSSRVARLQ
jgi:hypothetical protein